MKVKKISESYVMRLWTYIGVTNNLPNDLLGLNFNNYESINKIVEEYLIEELQNDSISLQFRTKESLRYAINFFDEKKLERLYDGALPEIGLPNNISCREFYINVWSNLYLNESYKIDDKSLYQDLGILNNV